MFNLDISAIAIILGTVLISYKGLNDQLFFNRYKFQVSALKSGDYVRFISSAFLHVDYSHLLVNMLTLYFFANTVIAEVGRLGFILIYVVSLLLGNLLSYFFHKNENFYSAVGASGAVIGVLYASILFRPDMMLGIFFIIPMPAYVFGIGYLLYSIWGMKANRDHIGHDAHFGGATGGFLLGILLNPSVLSSNLLMVGLLLVPIVLLFVLKYLGKL